MVHGRVSPTSAVFQKDLRLAHDVTRTALFRGLEIHCHLDDNGNMTALGDLHTFFERELAKKQHLLRRLYAELKIKNRMRRKATVLQLQKL